MKKLAIFFLVITAISAQAQETLHFKTRFRENATYTHRIENESTTSMTYEASPEMLQALKEQGIANPTIQNESSMIAMTMKTGKQENNTIPIVMDMDLGDKIEGFNGKLKVLGSVRTDGQPEFTSVEGEGLGEDFKEAFLTTVQSMLSQIKIPDVTLKVGESYVQKLPLSIPLGPISMDMTNSTTYILKRIEAGKAYLDIIHDFDMTTSTSGAGLDSEGSGSGKGTGTLVFDIKESYITKMENDITMDFNYATEVVQLKIQARTIQKNDASIAY